MGPWYPSLQHFVIKYCVLFIFYDNCSRIAGIFNFNFILISEKNKAKTGFHSI